MVAAGHHLPARRSFISRFQRRRLGRSPRHHREARLFALARRKRHLVDAVLPFAAARARLRRGRLLRCRPALRHARRLRPPRRGSAPSRPARATRLGRQSHGGGARVVQGVALEPRQSETRLVPLARRETGRFPAEQLDQRVRRQRVGMGCDDAAVLPSHVPGYAARLELAQPAGRGRDARDAAVLARPRRGRVQARCAFADAQRPAIPRQPAKSELQAGRLARQQADPALYAQSARDALPDCELARRRRRGDAGEACCSASSICRSTSS